MGCREQSGGDREGATWPRVAVSMLAPETGQSAGGCQGTGFGDQNSPKTHLQEGSTTLPGPSRDEKIVHGRGRLEPPEGTWGLCGPPATYAL